MYLDRNKMTDMGAKAPAVAIEKSTLKQISLGYNKVTDAGATALVAAVENSASPRVIGLTGNDQITDVGVKALATTLEKSLCIIHVHVISASLSKIGNRAIARAQSLRPARRAVWVVCGIIDDDRNAAIAHFLKADGDHAIMARVLQFLLEVGA